VGGPGGHVPPPIIWDFAPIQYLLNRKIPIYCVPLQYKFSDYLPEYVAEALHKALHECKIF